MTGSLLSKSRFCFRRVPDPYLRKRHHVQPLDTRSGRFKFVRPFDIDGVSGQLACCLYSWPDFCYSNEATMSAALTSHPDHSGASQQDISLGSLGTFSTGFGLGGDSRVPSISTRSTIPSTAPVSTPSPPLRRNLHGKGEDTPGSLTSRLNTLSQREREDLSIDAETFISPDVLATPAPDRALARKWDEATTSEGTGAALPTKANSKRAAGKGAGPNGKAATLTLRDQEKVSSLLTT